MNNFFVKTTIPKPNIDFKLLWDIEPTSKHNELPRFKEFRIVEYHTLVDLWEPEIRNKLISVDLFPRQIRVFRWRPNYVFPWHIDGNPNEAINFAINWVLDGSGEIQWNQNIILNKNTLDMSYGSKRGNIDDSYDCRAYGDFCIINTAIPHRVININNIHRITASMIYKKQITYTEAVNRLKSVNLLE
jgi:hypothetical protein